MRLTESVSLRQLTNLRDLEIVADESVSPES
jgi:hypothetical protein